VSRFDVVVSDFPEGTTEALAAVLERELGLEPEQAQARACSLPQTVLSGATREVADQLALRLLGAGAHVGLRPSPFAGAPQTEPRPTRPAFARSTEPYVMGELEPTSLRPRSLPPARVESSDPEAVAQDPTSSAPSTSPRPSITAGPRMLDEELEDRKASLLEIDEQALTTRSLYVRSERPEGWARRPTLPVVQPPGPLARSLRFTFKWGALAAVVIVAWVWLHEPEVEPDQSTTVGRSVRAIHQFLAPARELTLRGLHVVGVDWPSAADGSEPHVRCLLVEAPADRKIAVLRLGHTALDIPASVEAQLDDHASTLREALSLPELELTPVCLED